MTDSAIPEVNAILELAKDAADERQAAIVAWLRDPPEKQFVRDVAYLLADAIESGEWKGQG